MKKMMRKMDDINMVTLGEIFDKVNELVDEVNKLKEGIREWDKHQKKCRRKHDKER